MQVRSINSSTAKHSADSVAFVEIQQQPKPDGLAGRQQRHPLSTVSIRDHHHKANSWSCSMHHDQLCWGMAEQGGRVEGRKH